MSSEAPLSDKVSPAPMSPNKLPLKIADLSRKSLMSLDSQRILGVLDECIQNLELVALLPSKLSDPESLSLSLGAETVRSLNEHLDQVKKYNMDCGMKGQDAVAKGVQNSLLNVLRLLKACPTTLRELIRLGPITKDWRGVEGLVGGLREFRSVLLERLMMTPSEEREYNRHIQKVSLRHRSNVEVIATLEKDVASAVMDRDEAVSKKNEVIRQLKASLHWMEKTSKDFVMWMQKDAEKQNESDQKTSEGKQARLLQEASQLQNRLSNLISEHREAEMVLRKKNFKVETEIENWIQKYDADMGEKQTELEELTQIYEEEKAELKELQEHYVVLELEYSQIMEERRISLERREEEEKEREVKSHAAVIIQAFWRGTRVRKAMKAKAKSKKVKKGKGKRGK